MHVKSGIMASILKETDSQGKRLHSGENMGKVTKPQIFQVQNCDNVDKMKCALSPNFKIARFSLRLCIRGLTL